MKIEVNGVELTVTQDGDSVTVKRVVGRDRKRRINITGAVTFSLRKIDCVDPPGLELIGVLKRVASWSTARCTCDYRRGYSDHAEHCQSIYVASYEEHGYD